MRDVLIVSYGSIGKRHAQNLLTLGYRPVVLTKYPEKNESIHFVDSLDCCADVEYCIIATPTANRHEHFRMVTDSTACKNFLLEKPVDSDLEMQKKFII